MANYTKIRKHGKETFSIRPYEGQTRELRDLAGERGCSVNEIVCEAVKDYLKRHLQNYKVETPKTAKNNTKIPRKV